MCVLCLQVVYRIYCPLDSNTHSDGDRAAAEASWLARCTDVAASVCADHIWQRDALSLSVIRPRVSSARSNSTKGKTGVGASENGADEAGGGGEGAREEHDAGTQAEHEKVHKNERTDGHENQSATADASTSSERHGCARVDHTSVTGSHLVVIGGMWFSHVRVVDGVGIMRNSFSSAMLSFHE